jgi:hypothetical protein
MEAIRRAVAQSDQQFHTIDRCYLLLFFRIALADLTFLTALWRTPQYLFWPVQGTVIVGEDGTEKQLPLNQTRKFSVFERENICIAIGDRIRFTKNVKHHGQKLLNNELRTVVNICDDKIIFDKGAILSVKAARFLAGFDRSGLPWKVIQYLKTRPNDPEATASF